MVPRRLACLLLPAGLLLCTLPPRAETQAANTDARFAFADTTLLRDTLGLTFERLFPLADSLRMTPEALRVLSVTYRWTLLRLVQMSDSLDVPIDSVGPIMERERFNPLSNVVIRDQMVYTSTFSPRASGDSWNNDLDYTISRGKAFLSNKITVNLDENGKNGALGTRENRFAKTSLNWRVSPRFSAGTEATLQRYDNVTRSGLNGEAERINNFGFSVNARPRPWRGLTPTLSVVGGLETLDKLAESKRGASGTATGSLRYLAGSWFSHDLNFSSKSTISTASATDPIPDDAFRYPAARARDNSNTIRGTLNAFRSRPIELNVNYSFQNTRTQSPVAFNETTLVVKPLTNKQLIHSRRSSLDGTLRLRQGDSRSLDLGWKTGLNDNANTTVITSINSREDRALSANGRFEAGPLRFQSSFSIGEGIYRLPKRDFPRGGYREDTENRSLDGSVNWRINPKLSTEVGGSISLNVSRYARIDSARNVPVAHDVASQSYRADLKYTRSERASTTIGLRVSRSQFVNLPAASTASNSETRSYRATWGWTYRLLEGLTATQANGLNADYLSYPFVPASNRLSLDYSTLTTLNAVLNRRLTADVTHSARYQPSGNYRPQSPFDPTEYFSRADETRNYSLSARIYYTPIPAFSLNVAPEYSANARQSSQTGVLAPQRESRSLKFSGGANLNLRVGGRGRLTGNIHRTLNTDRVVNYGTLGTVVQPRTESGYLNGTLTFTWTL